MEAVGCPPFLPVQGRSPHSPPDDFRLIDLDQCIAMAGISASTFYRLVKDGRMPAPVKIGRANRWVEGDVIAAYKRLAEGASR